MDTETIRALRAGVGRTDSKALFQAVIRAMRLFERDCQIDDPPAFYEACVSEKVNDPESRFYMYG